MTEIKHPVDSNTVLIVVDVQCDFFEGGALPVQDGNNLFKPLNNYIKVLQNLGVLVAYTQDWHQLSHSSFDTNGGEWPIHCVLNTKGSELHPLLYLTPVHLRVLKGMKNEVFGYSAFEDTNLENTLRSIQIKNVIVCGVAASYCVKQTALSSCKLGFNTYVIQDLTKDVESSNNTWKELKEAGITII